MTKINTNEKRANFLRYTKYWNGDSKELRQNGSKYEDCKLDKKKRIKRKEAQPKVTMRLLIKHETLTALKFQKENRNGVVLEKYLKKHSLITSQDPLKSYKFKRVNEPKTFQP